MPVQTRNGGSNRAKALLPSHHSFAPLHSPSSREPPPPPPLLPPGSRNPTEPPAPLLSPSRGPPRTPPLFPPPPGTPPSSPSPHPKDILSSVRPSFPNTHISVSNVPHFLPNVNVLCVPNLQEQISNVFMTRRHRSIWRVCSRLAGLDILHNN